MDWTKTNVTSTMHICWGAQAGLYYHFGINKVLLPKKLFGDYPFQVLNRKVPLVRGFDDVFYAPNSRHTAILTEDIENCPDLKVLAKSEEAGVFLCLSNEGKQIFVMGQSVRCCSGERTATICSVTGSIIMYIRSLRMSCRETAENKQILGKSQRNKITLKLHIFMYFNGQMVSKQSLYII